MSEASDEGDPSASDGSGSSPSDAPLAQRVPLDLLTAVLLAVVAAVVLLEVDPGASVARPLAASPGAILARVVTLALGLPLLLFLPGYAVVAAAFPGHEPAVERIDAEGEPVAPRFQFRSRAGIDAIERATLAVGVSAAVTPLVALALNFTPWGLYAGPLVLALSGLVVLTSLVAAAVRLRLPPEDRFAPDFRPRPSPLSSGGDSTGPSSGEGSTGDSSDGSSTGAADVVLAVGLLVAVVGIGYAIAVPKPGSQFTELYLLSENENGTLVADDYPEFAVGEPTTLVVAVENREGRPANYSLVVELQRVETDGNRTAVRAEEQLHRSAVSLADGESARVRLRLAPTMTGRNLRLQVMLFDGPVPADPTAAAAYRRVNLWIDVAANGTAGNATTTETATATTAEDATTAENEVPTAGTTTTAATRTTTKATQTTIATNETA